MIYDPNFYYRKKFSWVKHCIYCGERASQLDHVFPFSIAMKIDLSNESVRKHLLKTLWIVPACRECNAIASNKRFQSILEKRSFIQSELKKKYRKLIHSMNWSIDELDELKYNLKTKILSEAIKKKSIQDRINFPMKVYFSNDALLNTAINSNERSTKKIFQKRRKKIQIIY